jgi:hypothetical protein
MKRLLWSMVFCVIIFSASAQVKLNSYTGTFSPEWHKGSIIFNTGDTVKCTLRYNQAFPAGILQLRKKEIAITIPPCDVKGFYYFDPKKDRVRKYYSMPLSANEPPTQEYFMECIYDDASISILNHKSIGVPYEYMNYSRFISKPSRISRKYILNAATGELLPLTRENALRLMGNNRKPAILSYIENHDIRFKSVTDYIHVFEYYSSL